MEKGFINAEGTFRRRHLAFEYGITYATSRYGILKLFNILSGLAGSSLVAYSEIYRGYVINYVIGAFVLSFLVSALFYGVRILGCVQHMNGYIKSNFDGFDFIWSCFSCPSCLAASIKFSENFPVYCPICIVSLICCYLTTIGYALETFALWPCAPASIAYITTYPGMAKTASVSFSATAFGLLVDSSPYYKDVFNWCQFVTRCNEMGIRYAVVASFVVWSFTTLLWLTHICPYARSFSLMKNFKDFEYSWALIGILLSGTAAASLAVNMDCSAAFSEPNCTKRTFAVVASVLNSFACLFQSIILQMQNTGTG